MKDVDEEEADGVVDAEDDKGGEGGGLVNFYISLVNWFFFLPIFGV